MKQIFFKQYMNRDNKNWIRKKNKNAPVKVVIHNPYGIFFSLLFLYGIPTDQILFWGLFALLNMTHTQQVELVSNRVPWGRKGSLTTGQNTLSPTWSRIILIINEN